MFDDRNRLRCRPIEAGHGRARLRRQDVSDAAVVPGQTRRAGHADVGRSLIVGPVAHHAT